LGDSVHRPVLTLAERPRNNLKEDIVLINIPIEPLEERYSKQWNTYFDEWLEDYPDKHITVKPLMPVTFDDEIHDGAFLDVLGTTYYKSQQIASIVYSVKKGEIPRDKSVIFLLHDGWFPVEQLAYMRDMLGCYNWRFVGLFHAGTYDRWDRTAQKGMSIWGEDLENSWFNIYDAVIVASNFHKRMLINTRHIFHDKIHVIPWKVEIPDMNHLHKENIVVFPHRLDLEKQPEVFRCMTADLVKNYHDWKFIWAKEICDTKNDYYRLLHKSRISVSCALQETFGIAMVESVLAGCIPVVPDRLSYKEMYYTPFRYKDERELIFKLGSLMNDPDQFNMQLKNLQLKLRDYNSKFFTYLTDVLEEL
jgi:hypothetical protein